MESSTDQSDVTESETNWEEAPPAPRTVVQAPVLASEPEMADSDEIKIKAEPTVTGDECRFMVNRSLFDGHSWLFANFESADGSLLAESLFSVDDVETLLVHGSTITVTRKDKTQKDWKPLATEVGAAVRKALDSGSSLLAGKIIAGMPGEEKIKEEIQKVIDTEVNPGVAGHGGKITLTSVKGNTVTIHMGGGCQGCSAADLTLKAGIHGAFRKAVPMVGAILDETNHAAGLNPYFS